MLRYFMPPGLADVPSKQNIDLGQHNQARFCHFVLPHHSNYAAYYKVECWLHEEEAAWCEENLRGQYQVERGEGIINGQHFKGTAVAFEFAEDAAAFKLRWGLPTGD